jgi:hypothetical protein
MAEDDDVQLVESIGDIDGKPPASNVQSVHMHGFVGANSTTTTLNPIVVVVVASNFLIIASDFVKVQMQQLVAIQAQAIAWKPHNRTSPCWGFFCYK